jgi:hypothetical protein
VVEGERLTLNRGLSPVISEAEPPHREMGVPCFLFSFLVSVGNFYSSTEKIPKESDGNEYGSLNPMILKEIVAWRVIWFDACF